MGKRTRDDRRVANMSAEDLEDELARRDRRAHKYEEDDSDAEVVYEVDPEMMMRFRKHYGVNSESETSESSDTESESESESESSDSDASDSELQEQSDESESESEDISAQLELEGIFMCSACDKFPIVDRAYYASNAPSVYYCGECKDVQVHREMNHRVHRCAYVADAETAAYFMLRVMDDEVSAMYHVARAFVDAFETEGADSEESFTRFLSLMTLAMQTADETLGDDDDEEEEDDIEEDEDITSNSSSSDDSSGSLESSSESDDLD